MTASFRWSIYHGYSIRTYRMLYVACVRRRLQLAQGTRARIYTVKRSIRSDPIGGACSAGRGYLISPASWHQYVLSLDLSRSGAASDFFFFIETIIHFHFTAETLLLWEARMRHAMESSSFTPFAICSWKSALYNSVKNKEHAWERWATPRLAHIMVKVCLDWERFFEKHCRWILFCDRRDEMNKKIELIVFFWESFWN